MDYGWVTDKMFQEKLEELVEKLVEEKGAGELLMIPGAYEVLSDYLNNDVLDALEEEREYSDAEEGAEEASV